MQLVPKTTEEFIVGAEKEMEFSIDTDSHIIFEILRDKMYSDKIGAVAREVSSNSRDANREAGNEHIPVTVEIVKPNKFASIGHQSIVFKDNGIGITPDRMSDVFVKYASSTKRDSNAQTGGFGLGAKTPFAYSDTFTVITVCDWSKPIIEPQMVEDELQDVIVGYEPVKRWKYTYNAILDKSNKGKMIQFDSEVVDEPTGTQIVVPIKTDSDRYDFEKKVIKSTKFWGDIIEYKGFYNERPKIEYVIDEPLFSVVKTSSDRRYGLLVDGINYPLDLDNAGIKDKGVGSGYIVLMKFNTGELTISANREAVQYDESSVAQIIQRHKLIKERIIELTQAYIKTLPSYLEACKFAFYMRQASQKQRNYITDNYLKVLAEAFNPRKDYYQEQTILSNDSKMFEDLTFGTKPLQPSIQFKYHTVAFVKKPSYEGAKINYDSIARVGVTENFATAPMYYANVAKNRRRNNTIWQDNDVFTLVLPRKAGTDQERLDEITQVIKDFDITLHQYGDVEMSKLDRGDSSLGLQDAEVSVNYRRVHYRSYNSGLFVLDKKTKKLKGGEETKYAYLAIESLRDATSHLYSDYSSKIDFVEKHTDKKVVVINKTAERNWISHTGMTTLEDEYKLIQKKFKAEWDKETKLRMFEDAFYEASRYTHADKYREFADILEPLMPKCIQGIDLFAKRDKKTYVKQELKFDVDGLEKKIKFIFAEKYPMLLPYLDEVVGWRNTDSLEKKRKIVKQYINSI